MTVPGTFKNRPPRLAVRMDSDALAVMRHLRNAGSIAPQVWAMGTCGVILSRDPEADGYVWHLSVSHPTRYPTWDEIKTARYSLPELANVTMAQILGPVEDESEWVNLHENCFHLYEIANDA